MKKILVTLLILAGITSAGFYGYNYALSFASDQLVEHIVNDLLDEQIIEEILSDHNIDQLVKELVAVNQNSKKLEELPFTTKEEGVKAVLNKFSLGEIKNIATQAQGGLTQEQQLEIAEKFQERLSEEEIKALMIIGIAELQKELIKNSQ